MQTFAHQPALTMRALAARFRGHATETAVKIFRHKFEIMASELEEAAVVAESRAIFWERYKLLA
jgi:hypothetical protein